MRTNRLMTVGGKCHEGLAWSLAVLSGTLYVCSVRWLLPLIAVFALFGQSVTAYAGAGMIDDVQCCCPVKSTCKCHDHDGKSPSSPTMKRCSGTAKIVAPAHVPATPAVAVEVASEPRVIATVAIAPAPIPDDVTYEPETPPF